MKKPVVLIAPGLGLLLIGSLMLVALAGFRLPASEAEIRVAGKPGTDLPYLTAAPRAEFVPGVVDAVRSMPEVPGVAEIRSGTRWLTAWANGGPEPIAPPRGLKVPVDAAAVDPEQYLKLVPPPQQALFAGLSGGGAILSRTAAALRNITEQGSLQFQGVDIPVIGVADDNFLHNHEVLMSHQTGASIQLDVTRYLVIGLDRLESGKAVEDRIRGAIPADVNLRVRGPEGSGASSAPSPLLPLGRIKTIFGEFAAVNGASANIGIDQAWVDANTEMASIHRLGTFRCHKLIIPKMREAFREVEEAGLGDLIRPGEFGGCYSPRYIRSGKNAGLSRHSWGIAFDFNVTGNLYGQPPTMDLRLVEIMERHGFSWGGRWTYPDGMHFEYVAG